MSGPSILSVREHPDWAGQAIRFFQDAWATDQSRMVYEDCIQSALLSSSPLPQWYVMVQDDRVLAGCGLIPNDFISRMDLWPWICAVYVSPKCRGRALGGRLLGYVRQDAARLGYSSIYLASDHVGYYEKYGFSPISEGWHPWGERSRIFRAETILSENGSAIYET